MDTRFTNDTYLVRRKVFKLFGGSFTIFGPDGVTPCFYSAQKAFKLRADIRVFGDQAMTKELLTIAARNIMDFSGVYDVTDAQTGEEVGILQRKGGRSILRDEWHILDTNGTIRGVIIEDSTFMALIRRFLSNLVPQTYRGDIGGQPVLEFRQNFNPFVYKIALDFSMDHEGLLDRRLGIAAAILLTAIEGKQN